MIDYSRGANRFDNKPEQRLAFDFDGLEEAFMNDRSERKGQVYICAGFRKGFHSDEKRYPGEAAWRQKNLVTPRMFAPFDFDGFESPDTGREVIAWLARYRGFVYTTASHRDDAPRCRVVLAQTRPTNRAEGIALCLTVQHWLTCEFGAGAIKFDDSVYKAEQPLYTPMTWSAFRSLRGMPLDVDAALRDAPEVIKTKVQTPVFRQPANSIEVAQFDEQFQHILSAFGNDVIGPHRLGWRVVCPNAAEHSDGNVEAVLMRPSHDNGWRGGFRCLHQHCQHVTMRWLRDEFLETHEEELTEMFRAQLLPVNGEQDA